MGLGVGVDMGGCGGGWGLLDASGCFSSLFSAFLYLHSHVGLADTEESLADGDDRGHLQRAAWAAWAAWAVWAAWATWAEWAGWEEKE